MMETTRRAITRNDVNLSEIEGLLRYLAIGFSFASSFQIVKSNSSASITKSEASRLRSEYSEMFKGRTKLFLRRCLPLLLIGIVEFAVQKADGVGLTQRLSDFKGLIRKYYDRDFTVDERTAILEMANSLRAPYYADTLNASLDPVKSFFDGKAPNSFSNAVSEFIESLDQPAVIVLDPADSGGKKPPNIRLLEEGEDDLEAVLPDFEIVSGGDTPPKDEDEPTPPKIVDPADKTTGQNSKFKWSLPVTAAVIGSIALCVGVVYTVRKRKDLI